MKKIVVLFACVCVLLSLVACEDKNKKVENVSGEVKASEEKVTSNSSKTSGDEVINVVKSGENVVMNEERDPKGYADVERNPIVTMEMKDGKKVTIELYPQIAPTTVENFVSLIQKGFYDGVIFHRVMPSFMAQGGDPQGNGLGGPGYSIEGEFSENGFTQNNLKHDIGVISMARATDPDSAGSQFFIVTSDQSYLSLDGKYAAFGKVVDGMDVVYEIVNSEVSFSSEQLNTIYEKLMAGDEDLTNTEIALIQAYQAGEAFDRPINPPVIKTMTVDTFGVDYLEPVKIAK